ncbi:efflux transporter outer membrane subunit [Pseudomonas sp. GD03944]|uniref:efflux transporter outer membrane subunit n=1 Tax=Pseudomonas sp. GD03944 TaxID=2975409 RepID=UPI00244AFA49|nr:efflux transporter outer membrane subunit [Pseudomonas sp. GD03944]MDH1265922.1 efflux transporter outer membrane subunit [Pseudomonas sp. GD03944]
MKRAHCLPLVLAALLGACASVTPEPAHLPFDLPNTFVAQPAGAIAPADLWWREFADERLDAFVDIALQRNPGLAQALARSRMAEAQVRLNRADQLPQVGIGAGAARQRQGMPDLMGGGTAPVISNNYDVALDVSWELDMWGRLSALTASARADYLASAEQLRGMRQSVAAEAVQLYFEIVHAHAQVELSERTTEALAEMARQINNRVEVGITSPADSMLAEANLESARAGLEQRREALARSLRQLQVLMGDYPSGQVETAASLPAVPLAPASGVPADLLARRPDVRAAELGLLSAGYQLGAAERSFLPSLSLTGSAGYAGSEFAELFSNGNLIWSIAGRALQPVFQGGRLVAQVDIAESQRDEALNAYAETALVALSEVESALAVDTLLARRESALDASASSAEAAVTVSLNRYLQGIDPFLNVLESQQRALDGRSAQITARHARLENRIALHLALGGGFEDALPAAEPDAP